MKVVIANRKIITDLKSEEASAIKRRLTYDNPAYINAVKFSKRSYIAIPQSLYYYKEQNLRQEDGTRKYCLNVPVGFDLSEFKNVEVTEDLRVDKEVEYPDFVLDLREEQDKAKKAYLDELKKASENYYPKSIIQLFTGQGKSILALYLAHKLRQKTLILVHKDDLVVGWQKDIKLSFGGKLKSGLVKAKKFDIGEQITIATFQTFHRMDAEKKKAFVNEFGLVIHDEMHRCGINIFNAIDLFNCKYRMGLSATPKRADGLDFLFTEFFGGICYVQEEASNDDILPVKVKIKEGNFAFLPYLYENNIINQADYSKAEFPLEAVDLRSIPYERRPRIQYLRIDDCLVSSREYMIQVCNDIIKEYSKGRSCIAFFTQKEHINQYYDFLKHFVGKDEIMLYYGDNKTSNKELLQKAESREVRITLATYAKATEGTNVKAWEVAFFVSSIASEKNVEQAVGRIRRACEEGIDKAILYDYRFSDSYSVSSHGAKRDSVYKRLEFEVEDTSKRVKKTMFSRGFR